MANLVEVVAAHNPEAASRFDRRQNATMAGDGKTVQWPLIWRQGRSRPWVTYGAIEYTSRLGRESMGEESAWNVGNPPIWTCARSQLFPCFSKFRNRFVPW